jgi:hypothetical protein
MIGQFIEIHTDLRRRLIEARPQGFHAHRIRRRLVIADY